MAGDIYELVDAAEHLQTLTTHSWNAVKSVAPVAVTNCGQVGVGVKPHFA